MWQHFKRCLFLGKNECFFSFFVMLHLFSGTRNGLRVIDWRDLALSLRSFALKRDQKNFLFGGPGRRKCKIFSQKPMHVLGGEKVFHPSSKENTEERPCERTSISIEAQRKHLFCQGFLQRNKMKNLPLLQFVTSPKMEKRGKRASESFVRSSRQRGQLATECIFRPICVLRGRLHAKNRLCFKRF